MAAVSGSGATGLLRLHLRLSRRLDEAFVHWLHVFLILWGVREFVKIRNYTVLGRCLLTLLLRSVVLGLFVACEGLPQCSVVVWFFLLKESFELIVPTSLFENPVELPVIIVAILRHHGLEQTAQVVVVGLLFKLKVATVLQVLHELFRNASRQLLDRGLALFVPNFIVLLVFVFSLEALPRQLAFQKVEQNVANRLEVITTRLLDADVRVDRSVAGSSGQGLVITVWNVLACLGVSVSLRKTKIDHVDHRGLIVDANQEIVRFHISVQEVLRVHEFDACNHLLSQHADRLQREATITELKEVLNRRAEQFHDHRLVIALDTVPINVRNAGYIR